MARGYWGWDKAVQDLGGPEKLCSEALQTSMSKRRVREGGETRSMLKNRVGVSQAKRDRGQEEGTGTSPSRHK